MLCSQNAALMTTNANHCPRDEIVPPVYGFYLYSYGDETEYNSSMDLPTRISLCCPRVRPWPVPYCLQKLLWNYYVFQCSSGAAMLAKSVYNYIIPCWAGVVKPPPPDLYPFRGKTKRKALSAL